MAMAMARDMAMAPALAQAMSLIYANRFGGCAVGAAGFILSMMIWTPPDPPIYIFDVFFLIFFWF